jgi:hypothetical protein
MSSGTTLLSNDAGLVQSYEAACGADWALGTNDGYYYQFLIHHMLQANMQEQASALLHDIDWLIAWQENAGTSSMTDALTFFARDKTLDRLYDRLGSADRLSKMEIAEILATPRSLARLRFWEQGPERFVLVVGTGGPQVTGSCVQASETVGRELARCGLGLISGGWAGVDHITCREYVKQLRRDEVDPKKCLVHVVPADSQPDFWADQEFMNQGDRDAAGQSTVAGHRSVDRSDAVIAIGGGSSAEEILFWAKAQSVPVFPISATGGAAERAYSSVSPPDPVVAAPIESARDALGIARHIAERVLMLPVRSKFYSQVPPSSGSSAGSNPDVAYQSAPNESASREPRVARPAPPERRRKSKPIAKKKK